MKRITTHRSQFDLRAIVLGAVAVTAVVTVVSLTPLPLGLGALGALAGGGVTGWTSRTFEGETIDGAVAAVLGGFLAVPVVTVGQYALVTAAGGNGLYAALFVLVRGWGLAFAASLVTVPLSMVAALVAARVRRRSDRFGDALDVRDGL